MGQVGNQDFWITGSRVFFQRDPVGTVVQPIIDFGRIDTVSPSVVNTVVQLWDSDGGIKRLIDQDVTQILEKYTVKASNFSLDMLTILFSANPGSAFAQSSTPVTSVQWAIPGRLLKIVNASGVLQYGIASITSINTSTPTPLVLGTDYNIISLERGLIEIISTSTVVDTAQNVTIVYVPRVISDTNVRLLNPQTTGIVNGLALVVWGRENNTQQTVREARMSISPNGSTFSDSAYSDHTIDMTVLNDLTLPVPAGRLLYWLGDTTAAPYVG